MKKITDTFLAYLFAKFPSLFHVWEKKAQILTFEETFWVTPPEDPHLEKIALLTTGGVHLVGDAPFDMKDRDGDPTYREIPSTARADDLTITHDYYDSRDARKDPGVVLPLDVLRDMESTGEVREVNHRHFSFMGHIKGRHLTTLIRETAPEAAAKLREDGVGAVILSPT